jgi:O-antigen/teichoic acid export membrane protein
VAGTRSGQAVARQPGRWLAEIRQLSGWFTATALLGQIQVQLVAFLVAGALGPAAFARLRLAQTAILAPAQNLMMATMGLLAPRASRLAAAGNNDQLRRHVRVLAWTLAAVATAAIAIVVPLARPALQAVLPHYADAAHWPCP